MSTHDKYPPSPIDPTATGKPHPTYTVQPDQGQLPDTGSSTPEYLLAAAVLLVAIGGAVLTRRIRR